MAWKRSFMTLLLLGAGCLSTAACGGGGKGGATASTAAASGSSTGQSPTITSVQSAHTLRACIDPEFKPEVYLDKSGQPAGLDVALTKALATGMGVKAQFVQTTFDGLIAGIEAKKCDIAISGITPRGTRALAVSFAKPTVVAAEALLVPKASSNSSLADFNQSSVRFCVQPGTGSQTDTQKYFPKGTEASLPGAQDCILQVLAGKADAFLTDTITAAGAVAQHPQLKVVVPTGVSLPAAPTAPAVRLGDLGFVAYLNTFFGEFINNGEYLPLCQQYLASACDVNALLLQRGNF